LNKNHIKIVILLLFSLLTNKYIGQSEFKSIVYSNEVEMSTNLTKSIIRDNVGYVWIGTDAGLVRFNGFEYESYLQELPSQYVKNLYKLVNGDILVVTDLGISKISWDGYKHIISVFIAGNSIRTDSTVFFPKSVYEDFEKNIWISEPDAVVKLADGKFRRYNFNNTQRADSYFRSFLFFEDKFGHLLITSQRGSVFLYDRNRDSFKSLGNFEDQSIRIDAFEITESSDILVGTNSGIYRLNHNLNLSKISFEKIVSLNNISVVRSYKNDNLLVGTWTDGLYQINKEGRIKKINDLEFDIISDIFISKDDNIWVSSDEGFALVYETNFSKIDLNSTGYYIQNVNLSDNGDVLVTDGNSVYLLKKEINSFSNKKLFEKKESLILSTAGTHDNLWVGYRDGFIEHITDNKTTRIYLPQTASVNRLVFSMLKDRRGYVWATEEGLNGILKFDDTNTSIYYDRSKGLNTLVQSVVEDKNGNIYVGGIGSDKYLFRYDSNTDGFVNMSNNSNLVNKSNFIVNDIGFDNNNNIWLASNMGLFFIDNGGELNRPNCLEDYPDLNIKSLSIDSNNNFWIGYEYGVLLVHDGNVTRFNLSDGLPNLTMTYRSSIVNSNKLVIGTAHGLASLQNEIHQNSKTAKPLITETEVNFVPVIQRSSELTFDYNSYLDFSFVSLTYPNDRINYQWRLKGKNSKWTDLKFDRNLELANLKDGTYVLEIRAKKNGYLWSDSEEVEFTILEPWYYSVWIILLGVIILIVFTKGVLSYYSVVKEKKGVEEKLHSFFSLSSDLILLMDKHGNIHYTNNILRRMESNSNGGSEDMCILDLVHVGDSQLYYDKIRELIKHEKSLSFELRMLNLNGEYEYYSWNFSISNDKKNIFGVGRNISAMMDMQKQLSELNSNKDKFFSIVAHDLKSPVFTLVGFSDILHEEYNSLDDEEIKDFIDRIYNQSNRINNLLSNLLDWGRIQLGRIDLNPSNFDIHSIVENSIQILKQNLEHKNITTENKIDHNIFVNADKNMIQSVMLNLLTNAIKFSLKKSKIIISSKRDSDNITISVRDFGAGISKNDITKLFRIDVPHKSIGNGKEKGTGLGLIITKELLERNNGTIWVESKSGEGSEFFFTIPLSILDTLKVKSDKHQDQLITY
jgi:signal transduction histidine kinase/ligand-binding sensor domain-containing protein